jgi:2,3-diketo-5-methylthio-1-phosphopentane phosphatase
MLKVFCDFDGTLTNKDTLAVLLDAYADSDWYSIEERALAGEIDERETLRAELALITAPDEDLERTLQTEICPAEGIDNLVSLVRENQWKMAVLSGGLIRFSKKLWEQWGYGDIPLFANDHTRDSGGRIEVIAATTPRIKDHCNHCKRWHLEEAIRRGSKVVYIGDGLTDFCPAEVAHRRYAKGTLLDHLRKQNLEVIQFDDLTEVVEDLRDWAK